MRVPRRSSCGCPIVVEPTERGLLLNGALHTWEQLRATWRSRNQMRGMPRGGWDVLDFPCACDAVVPGPAARE